MHTFHGALRSRRMRWLLGMTVTLGCVRSASRTPDEVVQSATPASASAPASEPSRATGEPCACAVIGEPIRTPSSEQERDRWNRARSAAIVLFVELERAIGARRCGSDLDAAIVATLDVHLSIEYQLLRLRADTCYDIDRWFEADPQIQLHRATIIGSMRAGCPNQSGERLARLFFYPVCTPRPVTIIDHSSGQF
jgi:hypothetical protein